MSSGSSVPSLASLMAVAFGAIVVATAPIEAQRSPIEPPRSPRAQVARVVPPTAAIAGLTYGEWSAVWWQWALEVTADQSPLLDQTGGNCAVGQSGPVWFLAGGFGGSYTRMCTVPPGTRLFFPVANAFCAAVGSFAEMRECASAFLEGAEYSVTIDGVDIPDLDRNRALSPEFALNLPDGNVFGVPGGTYAPAAADGIYLMLNPLTPGDHTVSFSASFADGTELDVTYYLTVA